MESILRWLRCPGLDLWSSGARPDVVQRHWRRLPPAICERRWLVQYDLANKLYKISICNNVYALLWWKHLCSKDSLPRWTCSGLSSTAFHRVLSSFGRVWTWATFYNSVILIKRYRRLKHLDAVVGFEVLNEPHCGFIGLQSLHEWNELKELRLGDSPSALQSFLLGEGVPQKVPIFSRSWPWPTRKDGVKLVNEGRRRAWLPGRRCIWYGCHFSNKLRCNLTKVGEKTESGICRQTVQKRSISKSITLQKKGTGLQSVSIKTAICLWLNLL